MSEVHPFKKVPGAFLMLSALFWPAALRAPEVRCGSLNNGESVYTGQVLYCHDISSGKSWCNDTPLSSVSGLPIITAGANQLTWKDSSTLLISTYNGYVLQYTLP
jgi:hypothetical protein